MPDADDTADLQEQLAAHRAHACRSAAPESQSRHQPSPPGVHNGIAEARPEIARLKAALRDAGVDVDNEDQRRGGGGRGAQLAGAARVAYGDSIGRDQNNAQGSQGYINRANTPNSSPAQPLILSIASARAVWPRRGDLHPGWAADRRPGRGGDLCGARPGPASGKTDLLRATGRDARITAHFAGGGALRRGWPHAVALLDPAALGRRAGPPSAAERRPRDAGRRGARGPARPPRPAESSTMSGRAALARRGRWASAPRPHPACWPAAAARRWPARPPSALSRSRFTCSPRLPRSTCCAAAPPPPIARDEASAAELAQALGYLPLALKLAGHLLANDRCSPQPIRRCSKPGGRGSISCAAAKRALPPRLPQRGGVPVRASSHSNTTSRA